MKLLPTNSLWWTGSGLCGWSWSSRAGDLRGGYSDHHKALQKKAFNPPFKAFYSNCSWKKNKSIRSNTGVPKGAARTTKRPILKLDIFEVDHFSTWRHFSLTWGRFLMLLLQLHGRVLPQEDDGLFERDGVREVPGGFPLPFIVGHLFQLADLFTKKKTCIFCAWCERLVKIATRLIHSKPLVI